VILGLELARSMSISHDDVGRYGPYETFADAAAVVSLFTKTDATTRIWIDPYFRRSEAPNESSDLRGELSGLHLELGTSKSAATTSLVNPAQCRTSANPLQRRSLQAPLIFFGSYRGSAPMMTNGYEHMSANEFNAAMLEHRTSGGTFFYLTGWLPDANRRVSEGESMSELHLVANMAMEAQAKGQVCLTQKCLRRGEERQPPIYEPSDCPEARLGTRTFRVAIGWQFPDSFQPGH
jgi:hypothetical protein